MFDECQTRLFYAKRFGKDNDHSSDLVLKNKWYCISEDSPQEIWDNMTEGMFLEFAESDCAIFRATSPLSTGDVEAKDMENCRYTMQPIWKRLLLFFA